MWIIFSIKKLVFIKSYTHIETCIVYIHINIFCRFCQHRLFSSMPRVPSVEVCFEEPHHTKLIAVQSKDLAEEKNGEGEPKNYVRVLKSCSNSSFSNCKNVKHFNQNDNPFQTKTHKNLTKPSNNPTKKNTFPVSHCIEIGFHPKSSSGPSEDSLDASGGIGSVLRRGAKEVSEARGRNEEKTTGGQREEFGSRGVFFFKEEFRPVFLKRCFALSFNTVFLKVFERCFYRFFSGLKSENQ